jgi:two-component system, sensor histidine kinase and response regulator
MENTAMRKILIVDDSSTNNLLFQHLLEEEGYTVIIADNGEDAIKMADNDRPHLILLDIMLPGVDGFQVLQKLKENEKTKDIPVVMVTAKNDTWSMKKSMDLGAYEYVVKPIQVESFLDKVKDIFE